MGSYSISFGHVTISLRSWCLVISVARHEVDPAAAKPSLNNGRYAEHLTIPFKPRAGRSDLWVHLTYADGKHKGIVKLKQEDLEAFGAKVNDCVSGFVLKSLIQSTRQIDTASLVEQGHVLMFCDEEVLPSKLSGLFGTRRARHFRVSEAKLAALNDVTFIGDAFYLVEPTILDDEEFRHNAPRPLCALYPNGMTATWLRYETTGWMGGPPGWYGYPDEIIRVMLGELPRALLQAVEPHFWTHVKTIANELGLPIEQEVITALATGQVPWQGEPAPWSLPR